MLARPAEKTDNKATRTNFVRTRPALHKAEAGCYEAEAENSGLKAILASRHLTSLALTRAFNNPGHTPLCDVTVPSRSNHMTTRTSSVTSTSSINIIQTSDTCHQISQHETDAVLSRRRRGHGAGNQVVNEEDHCSCVSVAGHDAVWCPGIHCSRRQPSLQAFLPHNVRTVACVLVYVLVTQWLDRRTFDQVSRV